MEKTETILEKQNQLIEEQKDEQSYFIQTGKQIKMPIASEQEVKSSNLSKEEFFLKLDNIKNFLTKDYWLSVAGQICDKENYLCLKENIEVFKKISNGMKKLQKKILPQDQEYGQTICITTAFDFLLDTSYKRMNRMKQMMEQPSQKQSSQKKELESLELSMIKNFDFQVFRRLLKNHWTHLNHNSEHQSQNQSTQDKTQINKETNLQPLDHMEESKVNVRFNFTTEMNSSEHKMTLDKKIPVVDGVEFRQNYERFREVTKLLYKHHTTFSRPSESEMKQVKQFFDNFNAIDLVGFMELRSQPVLTQDYYFVNEAGISFRYFEFHGRLYSKQSLNWQEQIYFQRDTREEGFQLRIIFRDINTKKMCILPIRKCEWQHQRFSFKDFENCFFLIAFSDIFWSTTNKQVNLLHEAPRFLVSYEFNKQRFDELLKTSVILSDGSCSYKFNLEGFPNKIQMDKPGFYMADDVKLNYIELEQMDSSFYLMLDLKRPIFVLKSRDYVDFVNSENLIRVMNKGLINLNFDGLSVEKIQNVFGDVTEPCLHPEQIQGCQRILKCPDLLDLRDYQKRSMDTIKDLQCYSQHLRTYYYGFLLLFLKKIKINDQFHKVILTKGKTIDQCSRKFYYNPNSKKSMMQDEIVRLGGNGVNFNISYSNEKDVKVILDVMQKRDFF